MSVNYLAEAAKIDRVWAKVRRERKKERLNNVVTYSLVAALFIVLLVSIFWFNTPHLVDNPAEIAEIEANLDEEFSKHYAEFQNLLAETVKQKQGVTPEKIVFQFEYNYRRHASLPSGVKVWYRVYDGSWYQWRFNLTEEHLDFLAKKTYDLD